MKIIRSYSGWNWTPRLYRAQHVDAPYRMIIAWGFWLAFIGGKHD